jgi:cyclopropane-fatty-acyl-phospholipid synthase
MLGAESPVAFEFWDGSRLGPSGSDATVRVASPGAIRRLLWSPDELGPAPAGRGSR